MADSMKNRSGRRRGRGRGLTMLLLAAVVVLAGGGGATWYFAFGGKAMLAAKPSPAPNLVSLKPFVVTLRDENKDLHFVQLGIDLDVEGAEASKTVITVLPEVKDAIRLEILKHGVADITTPDGIGRLRDALVDSVNGTIKAVLQPQPTLAAETVVRGVYFSELVVE
jgi:flagellar basal body-associated protein FliL